MSKHIYRFCRQARIAYDIGSANGYCTLAFCRLMSSNNRVYAFEANPHLGEVCRLTKATH